jgi:hypothetical protein
VLIFNRKRSIPRFFTLPKTQLIVETAGIEPARSAIAIATAAFAT